MKNRFKLEAILMIVVPLVIFLVGIVALIFFSQSI
jgi:hypothetical protein